MRRKIDYNMVKIEFEERGYILLSTEYIDNSTKLQYLCPNHLDKGVQEITFANFTKGRGCGYCAKRKKKTQQEYIEELTIKKPNIEVLGTYDGLKVKVLHKCKVCGYEWEVIPDNLLNSKNGCPKCGKRAKLANKEFLEKLNEINPSIKPLDEYITNIHKIHFLCSKCGFIWEAKPNNILNGKGCPKCKSSKGEQRIQQILDKHNIKYDIQYKFNNCCNENVLPFDFYLPQYNLCIEYDGIQHFLPCTFGGISEERAKENLESCKLRDSIKDNFCQVNGIKLLRIPYTQFNNIESIITSIIC